MLTLADRDFMLNDCFQTFAVYVSWYFRNLFNNEFLHSQILQKYFNSSRGCEKFYRKTIVLDEYFQISRELFGLQIYFCYKYGYLKQSWTIKMDEFIQKELT